MEDAVETVCYRLYEKAGIDVWMSNFYRDLPTELFTVLQIPAISRVRRFETARFILANISVRIPLAPTVHVVAD